MKDFARPFRWSCTLAIMIFAFIAMVSPASAQKKKDKKNATPQAEPASDSNSFLPVPDTQMVERAVSEMLGYWQIGDVESLHKYYADDTVAVSGAWEPPIIGWANYLKAYQAQRARVSGGRLDRTNTFIKINGNSAWATYQFIYHATVDGKIADFHGHTSLVLNKRDDRWVIVLNHSSVVPETGDVPSSVQSSRP